MSLQRSSSNFTITQTGTDILSSPSTSGWGSTGAHSTQTINQGDYVEYEIGNDALGNYHRSIVGLSYTPAGKDMGLDYNFYISGSTGEHYIYTAGVGRTRYVTPFNIQNGNKYKIWRNNGNVELYVNNTLDRTFVDQYPNRPMYLEVAFNDPNRKIKNLYIYKEVRKYFEEITDVQTFTKDGSYRYSFQGQEHDDEIKGKGNSINYKYRMHDPRLGRFFAVDPLSATYPYNSPYAFSENTVLNAIELEGLEKVYVYNRWTDGKGIVHTKYSHTYIDNDLKENLNRVNHYNSQGEIEKSQFKSGRKSGTTSVTYSKDDNKSLDIYVMFDATSFSKKSRNQQTVETNVSSALSKDVTYHDPLAGGDDGANTGNNSANRQAPKAIKVIVGLNPLITIVDLIKSTITGEDIYGKDVKTNKELVWKGVNAAAGIIPIVPPIIKGILDGVGVTETILEEDDKIVPNGKDKK